ncbi:MarR family transcriptional regulator [Leisingera sp. XS_AS12]|uniref:MarR family transcriptional regulator n=1 Tax=Leisingera sp. XS_AS12 TaxID=3241294 RepID=UPI00351314EA
MARTPGAKGLTPHQLDVIRVGVKLGKKQAEIARILGRTKQAIHQAKKRMEAEGTIETIPFDLSLIEQLFDGGRHGS